MDGLPKSAGSAMIGEPSSVPMKISEDDKWYIAETAQAALPSLIEAFGAPAVSRPEMASYAKNLGVLAHLVGVHMLNARENMFATIAKASQEKKNDAPAS